MDTTNMQIVVKLSSVLFIVSTVVVVFFGLTFGMDNRMEPSMMHCVFDQSLDCPTNSVSHVIGHIQHWQQTFAAVQLIPSSIVMLFVVLFVSTVLFLLAQWQHYMNMKRLPPFTTQWRYTIFIAKLFNSIVQALSNGIISPKIYTPSPIH